MERYKNLSHNSGVVAYEIGRDSIAVQFQDGGTYIYTSQSTSLANVKEMQRLALAGHGLCSFISRNVRGAYARKLP